MLIVKKLFSFLAGKQKAVDKRIEIEWKELQNSLHHMIKRYDLYREALTHRSFFSQRYSDKLKSNERLEFLGDAVINLVVAEILFEKYPEIDEGDLTKKRAILVSRKILFRKSKELDLGKFLLIGDCEERTNGRKKASLLTNTIEAVVGAYYLENGYEKTKKYLQKFIYRNFEEIFEEYDLKNFKGELLEYIQKTQHKIPIYYLKREEGPDHRKIYTVNVKIGNKILGTGRGRSKKIAEQKAAQKALEKMKVH